MKPEQTLEEILEIIKFTLTNEQKDAIKQKLDDLYNQGGTDYSWNFCSKGID